MNLFSHVSRFTLCGCELSRLRRLARRRRRRRRRRRPVVSARAWRRRPTRQYMHTSDSLARSGDVGQTDGDRHRCLLSLARHRARRLRLVSLIRTWFRPPSGRIGRGTASRGGPACSHTRARCTQSVACPVPRAWSPAPPPQTTARLTLLLGSSVASRLSIIIRSRPARRRAPRQARSRRPRPRPWPSFPPGTP